ncbi:PilZ domain-containing protein [Thermodesulfobacteriota bacterium]
MVKERRRFTRIPFTFRTEMKVDDTSYVTDEISNISIGGCSLGIKADLKVGTLCEIIIRLSGDSSELNVSIRGEIIRCRDGIVAVKFTGIDPDSLFHLQNIVRYNSADPDKIEQEINERPGII